MERDRNTQITHHVTCGNTAGRQLLCRIDLAFNHPPFQTARPTELACDSKACSGGLYDEFPFISAKLALTWNRPEAGPVSMESVGF